VEGLSQVRSLIQCVCLEDMVRGLRASAHFRNRRLDRYPVLRLLGLDLIRGLLLIQESLGQAQVRLLLLLEDGPLGVG